MAITLIVSLGVGAIVIAAVGLVMYMSQLVRNAYALKIEMQTELESGLSRVEEEADKKIKWIRRDMVEEITRSKDALQADNARRFQEFQDAVNRRLQQVEETARRDRAELAAVLEGQKQVILALDHKMRDMQREQRRVQLPPLSDILTATDPTPVAPEPPPESPAPPPTEASPAEGSPSENPPPG